MPHGRMPGLMDDTQDQNDIVAHEKEHRIREVSEKRAPDLTMDHRKRVRPIEDCGKTLFDGELKT